MKYISTLFFVLCFTSCQKLVKYENSKANGLTRKLSIGQLIGLRLFELVRTNNSSELLTLLNNSYAIKEEHRKRILNTANKDGQTLAIAAAEEGSTACLEILIAAGINLTAKDKQDRSAFDVAKEKGHEGCIKLLSMGKENI